jgi:hypothetical protein
MYVIPYLPSGTLYGSGIHNTKPDKVSDRKKELKGSKG